MNSLVIHRVRHAVGVKERQTGTTLGLAVARLHDAKDSLGLVWVVELADAAFLNGEDLNGVLVADWRLLEVDDRAAYRARAVAHDSLRHEGCRQRKRQLHKGHQHRVDECGTCAVRRQM